MRTKKNSASAQAPAATVQRRRKASQNRAGRTYYGVDGSNIYRFATHANRLQAMQGSKMKELGALEFRDLVADGKHTLIDTRSPGPNYMAPVSEPVPVKQAQAIGNSLDIQTLTASIVKAVTKSLRGAGVPFENLQPSSNRMSADH